MDRGVTQKFGLKQGRHGRQDRGLAAALHRRAGDVAVLPAKTFAVAALLRVNIYRPRQKWCSIKSTITNSEVKNCNQIYIFA